MPHAIGRTAENIAETVHLKSEPQAETLRSPDYASVAVLWHELTPRAHSVSRRIEAHTVIRHEDPQRRCDVFQDCTPVIYAEFAACQFFRKT